MIGTQEDPLGLIEQMYPEYWPESKRKEVRQWTRMRQIVEVQKYRKYDEVYEVFSEERIRELLEKEGKWGTEQVGEHWFRVHCGKDGFYTDRKGVEEFERLLRERMSRLD